MTNIDTQISALKSGQRIHFDDADAAIRPVLASPDPVPIRPVKGNEDFVSGTMVLHSLGNQARLRIVHRVTNDSCQMVNGRGIIEGWILKSAILGIAEI